MGYAQQSMREHRMAQKEEKCVCMGIPRNFPSGTISVLLVKARNIVERQAVQWVNGPNKTGSDGVGKEYLGAKPDEDIPIVKIGAL